MFLFYQTVYLSSISLSFFSFISFSLMNYEISMVYIYIFFILTLFKSKKSLWSVYEFKNAKDFFWALTFLSPSLSLSNPRLCVPLYQPWSFHVYLMHWIWATVTIFICFIFTHTNSVFPSDYIYVLALRKVCFLSMFTYTDFSFVFSSASH